MPAIMGVRLKHFGYSGHFVAALRRQGNRFVIADPMHGLVTNVLSGLEEDYEITGFFLAIEK